MGRRRALLLAAALAVAGASGLGAADAAGEGHFPRLVVQPPSDNPAVPAYLSRAIVAPLKLPRGQPLCVVTRVEVKGSAAAGDAGSSSTPQDPPLNNDGAFVEEDPAPAPEVTTPRGVLDHIGEFTGVTNVVEESGSTTALLSRPENIEFKRVAQHFFSDVDPRADYALLGTPGGDMGELLNAMAAVEAASGTLYRPETASVAFQDFLRAMSSRGRRYFYMGTDEAAMAALAKHTGVSDPTRPQSITERNKVLESCVHPEHVGSRHLRGMLTLPATYGVRTELAVYLIRSFWSVYFDPHNPLRRRLLLVKLRGELKPAGAAARVWSPDACPGIAPLLVPSTPKGAVSVYHEAHAKFFRLDLARFFAFRNAELDAGSLYNSMNRLASKQAVLLSDYFSASGIVDVIFTSAVDRWPF